MTVYMDYSYYTSNYGGTVVLPAGFTALANHASAIIDYLTFGRAAPIMALEGQTGEDAATIDKIKMATCAVLETLNIVNLERARLQTAGGGVKSESVGSHSVTYMDIPLPGTVNANAYYKQFADSAKVYLATTGLMYRGFYSGEYGGYPVDE